ncbi:hypothetical protein [Sunxiuqinia indica]|uniref:hypothetical protein n=1 Tax=Sunxiuqinia indica TaxID=2692584 RepID=UPI001F25B61B|nr:hypothetical protein [Sunxiuqinia indica]
MIPKGIMMLTCGMVLLLYKIVVQQRGIALLRCVRRPLRDGIRAISNIKSTQKPY